MKVLFAHNYYQFRGGEDDVVENESRLLQSHGHGVRVHSVSNDTIKGLARTLEVAWHAPYSQAAKERLAAEIASFRPDVLHVHNFFPLLTPAIYDAAAEAGVPVVQTVHNFRLLCIGALLMREGKICEKCVGGSPYWGVLHRCYHGSTLQSLAVARMNAYHQRRGTWHEKVDRFIAPSLFLKQKLVAGGFPGERIVVKPNFVPEPTLHGEPAVSLGGPDQKREGALFAARLSVEKGLGVLLEAWRDQDEVLRIAGVGPLRAAVEAMDDPRYQLLGQLTLEDLWAEMRRAAYLIMPSVWYEGMPLIPIHAFASGLPVIASRLGAMATMIEDGVTGLLFEPGDARDLLAKIEWARAHPEEMLSMGRQARRVYEDHYSPKATFARLMAIYDDVTPGSRKVETVDWGRNVARHNSPVANQG